MKRNTTPAAMHPRGLTREQAAAYAGCRTLSAFNDRVRKGLLPRPMPGTHTWDRKAIDAYLDKASGIVNDAATSTKTDEWLARRHKKWRAKFHSRIAPSEQELPAAALDQAIAEVRKGAKRRTALEA